MGTEYGLKPDMGSLKLQVVSFWRQYEARWGQAPSYGEIANAMNVHRSTARDAVKRAVRDRLIERAPGARRGGRPASDALPRLTPEQAGYMIAQLRKAGVLVADASTGPGGRTYCSLPLLPELDHIPCGDDGDEQDEWANARRAGGHAGHHEPGAPEGDRRAA